MKPHWRVLIIDDHAPSRAAVAEAVAAQGGQVVGNGSRAEDVLRLVDKYRPDVAVLAGGLPDGDRVEGAREGITLFPCPVGSPPSPTHPPAGGPARGGRVAGLLP